MFPTKNTKCLGVILTELRALDLELQCLGFGNYTAEPGVSFRDPSSGDYVFLLGGVHIARPYTLLLEASLFVWLVALGFRAFEN